MLVSHRKKFIYTKTIKTAGTSVELYFEKYCMPEGEWTVPDTRDQYICNDGIIGYRGVNAEQNKWYNHMSALDIKNQIGAETWDNYFKFCVIRNPFDRLVSAYFFQSAKGLIGNDENTCPIENFRRWLAQRIPLGGRNAYTIDKKICLDYFIRFEDLETGIEFVCTRLGLPFEPENIPQLKAGIRDQSIPVKSLYTKELKQRVAKAYAFEIREFGYSFPL